MSPLLLACLSLTLLSDPPQIFVKPGERLAIEGLSSEGSGFEAQWNVGLIRPVTTLTAPEEGQHYLALFTRDALGSVSEPSWYLVQVDGLAPKVEVAFEGAFFDSEQDLWWVHPQATMHFSVSDEGAGVSETRVTIQDQPPQRFGEAKFSLAVPAAERTSLAAQASDHVNNLSAPLTLQIARDAVPPQVEVAKDGPHVIRNQETVLGVNGSLHVNASDAESGLSQLDLRLNGQPVDAETLRAPWQPGRYQLEMSLMDRVGNVATPAVLEVVVDHTPPELAWQLLETNTAFTNAQGEAFYRFPLQIALTAVDDEFGAVPVSYFHPEKGWLSASGPISITLPALRVKASDPLGNASQKVFTWNTDFKPPEIRLTSASGQDLDTEEVLYLHFGDELFPHVRDNEAGLKEAFYRLDEGPLVQLPNVFRFTQKDQFVLSILATDHFGNTSRRQWKLFVKRSSRGAQP